jgi:tetratricopeptide (TPR) repeat protein
MAEIKHLEKAIITAMSAWQFGRALGLCQKLLTAVPASAAEARESRLLALFHYGEAARRLLKHNEAMALFEKCYEEAGGSGRYAIKSLERLAHVLAQTGDIARAKERLQEAADLAEMLEDVTCRAIVIHERGNLAWFQEHLDEALSLYHQARAIYEQLHDLESQLTVWLDIGLAHHYIGRLDKAIASYQEALKLAHHLRYPGEGMLLSNLGECYQDLFAMEQARHYHEQAITAIHSLPLATDNLPSTLADIHRNLGVDLYYLGDIESGRKQLETALTLLKEEDDLDIRLQTLYTFALVELEQGQLEQAWQRIQKSLALAEQHELRVHTARALYLAGLYHQQRTDQAGAQVAWQQCQFLAHETGQRMVLWQVHVAQGDATNNAALATVHYQIAAEIINQIAAPIADEPLRQAFLNAPQVKRVLDNKF